MARLVFQTKGFNSRVVDLGLGVSRVGRDPDCELYIEHDTISVQHCELRLSADGIYVHDCQSTNGTFINGEPVLEAWLDAGQVLKIGAVELLVESTAAHIAIPKFARARPKSPVVLPDGAMVCPRHPEAVATFQCTRCREIMCAACVHLLKIKGGKPLFLCPLCSNKCERLAGVEKPKPKKGLRGFLETVRLRFGPDRKKK